TRSGPLYSRFAVIGQSAAGRPARCARSAGFCRSVGPLDAEIREIEHRLPRERRRKALEVALRRRAELGCAGQTVGESGAPLQECDGMREAVLALLAPLERTAPEPALGGIAALEGQDHGQGGLAVAEVVADALAQNDFARAVVQHIIDQLKGDAHILS